MLGRYGILPMSDVDPHTEGDVVQLVRTPACHVGGRGFEPRRPRHLTSLPFSKRSRLSAFRAVVCSSLARRRLFSCSYYVPQRVIPILAPPPTVCGNRVAIDR